MSLAEDAVTMGSKEESCMARRSRRRKAARWLVKCGSVVRSRHRKKSAAKAARAVGCRVVRGAARHRRGGQR